MILVALRKKDTVVITTLNYTCFIVLKELTVTE